MSGEESSQVATFLVKWMPMLIQRVTGVMPIADQLLSQGVIGQELYEGIHALNTRQYQMRYLLEALRSPQEKLGLYRILQEKEPHLMEELKNSKFESMEVSTDLYETLDDLPEEEFKRFKDSLNQNRKGFTRIPWGKLEKADVTDTVRLMRDRYGDQQSLQLAKDIITTLRGRPATGMTRNVNALTLGNLEAESIPSSLATSPSIPMASSIRPTAPPRSWTSDSERWRKAFEELVNMPEEEVTTKDSLVFVTDNPRFRIADKGHTEVLLGLQGDGREVAIKMIKKSKDKVIDRKVKEERKVLWKNMYKTRHVVQYVYSTYDEKFDYIAMQLCEYNLEEYIKEEKMKMTMDTKTKFVKEFLMGLKELHDVKVIHRDIKPSNVLIDKDGCARIADFGISRTLAPDQSTIETDKAGTKCWEATEIVVKPGGWRYKRSTDIQVAGMLVYYILSGGHHPFGDDFRCQTNIADGKDTLDPDMDAEAKDLVKRMINKNPKRRPRIDEVLQHPFFWEEERKQLFLKELGNVASVRRHLDFTADEDLTSKMQGKSFSAWKTQLNHLSEDLEGMKRKWLALVQTRAKDEKIFPQRNLLSLLRFIRNRMDHSEEMEDINVLKLFPDLLITAYNCAIERKWKVKGFQSVLLKSKADSPSPDQDPAKSPKMETQPVSPMDDSPSASC